MESAFSMQYGKMEDRLRIAAPSMTGRNGGRNLAWMNIMNRKQR